MEGWAVAVIVRNDAKVELLVSKVKTVNGYRPQSAFWGTWLCTEIILLTSQRAVAAFIGMSNACEQ